MARQFRDRDGVVWIADYFGSVPSQGASVYAGPPIEVGNFDQDQLSLERLDGKKRFLVRVPRGRWPDAVTENDLRDALEQALLGER